MDMPIFSRQQTLQARQARFWWRVLPWRPGLYIFTYHSILNPAEQTEWERAYQKIVTRLADFAAHMAWIAEHMTPLATSEALALPDLRAERYALVHFDDAYLTLLTQAQPVLARYGIRPTVFVNADFAVGREVYYRVLGALMHARGQSAALVEALRARGFDPQGDVFAFLKNAYRAGETEAAVYAAWDLANPGEAYPRMHLNWDELRTLHAAGWEIGNHTASHYNLSDLDMAQHDEQIAKNQARLAAQALSPQPWLAYPNGWLHNVGPATARWMAHHTAYHGFFGQGGINRSHTRADWLRIMVGDWSLKQFVKQARKEQARTP